MLNICSSVQDPNQSIIHNSNIAADVVPFQMEWIWN